MIIRSNSLFIMVLNLLHLCKCTPVTEAATTAFNELPLMAALSNPLSTLIEKFGATISILQDDKTRAILKYDSHQGLIDCMLYDLEKPSAFRATQQAADFLQLPILTANFHDMMGIIKHCRELDSTRSPELLKKEMDAEYNNVTELTSVWRGILPGTKWCGLGDEASDYSDIGFRYSVDSCCRSHDHCPVRLKSFRFGYGLMNLSMYTKSHCECDDDFYKCLKGSKSPVAEMVGNIYFNVMRFGCIQEKKSSCTADGQCTSADLSQGRSFVPQAPQFEFATRNIRF